MYSVLVIGPSDRVKGGITSVIKVYSSSLYWKKINAKWIYTYDDRNNIYKIIYFIRGLIQFLLCVRNYDIIHVHYSEHISAARKIVFIYIGRIMGKKIVSHFHSFSVASTINSKYSYLYEYIFKNSDANIVLSEYWKSEVCKVYRSFLTPDKVYVVYNPVEYYVNDEMGLREKRKSIVLCVGSIEKRKGYIEMINAFSLIIKNYPEWKLYMAGAGEIDIAKALVAKLNIENNVVFCGWLNKKQLSRLYKSASIFCMPSYAEGFPMAVLEAWSNCIPSVVTPVGGLIDVIINKENCLVVKPGDVMELSNAVKMLIKDECLRKKISMNASALVGELFLLDNVEKIIKHIYDGILNKKKEENKY